jgi:hypothetical protein
VEHLRRRVTELEHELARLHEKVDRMIDGIGQRMDRTTEAISVAATSTAALLTALDEAVVHGEDRRPLSVVEGRVCGDRTASIGQFF